MGPSSRVPAVLSPCSTKCGRPPQISTSTTSSGTLSTASVWSPTWPAGTSLPHAPLSSASPLATETVRMEWGWGGTVGPWGELCLLWGFQAMCAMGPALQTHLGTSFLAGSAELIPIAVSSFAIVLFLLGILGALLVCMYLKKPMRPPSVLVRQRAHSALCGCCKGWERQATSRDEAGLIPLFSVPPRSPS